MMDHQAPPFRQSYQALETGMSSAIILAILQHWIGPSRVRVKYQNEFYLSRKIGNETLKVTYTQSTGEYIVERLAADGYHHGRHASGGGGLPALGAALFHVDPKAISTDLMVAATCVGICRDPSGYGVS